MENRLFRKKTFDKATSPENLDTFLRVTNPSMWVAMAALLIVLVGAITWATFGTIESTAAGVVVSDESESVCYVSEKDITKIEVGMTVRVGDERLAVSEISSKAQLDDYALSDYAMQLGGFESGEYVYALSLDGKLGPGNHECEVVIETLSPIDFLD